MEDIGFQLTIPSDEDGHVLLRCSRCGELFKVSVEEMEDDSVLDTYCPACGMTADNFLTEDVVRLALATATNRAASAVAKELDRQLSGVGGGLVSISVDMETDKEPEIPLKASIEALELVHCPDCGRASKIQPALAMSMSVCPYCGIGQFNER